MKCEGAVLTYGAVEHAGQTALVMKLYEGGSLAALLGLRRLSRKSARFDRYSDRCL